MSLKRKVKQNIYKVRNDFHFKELLKGSVIALIFRILSIFSGYLLFFILTRLYGAEGVGFYSFAWTLLMVSVVFSKLGFDSSIVKFIAMFASSDEEQYISGVYIKSLKLIFVSSIIVTAILMCFSDKISLLFFQSLKYQSHIFYLSFAVIPLTILNINAESQKALKKITIFSMLQNGSINFLLTIVVLLFVFVHFTNNYYSIVFGLIITILFLMFVSFVFVNKNINFSINPTKAEMSYKNLLKTTIPMLLTNSLFLIMTWTDTLMLTAFKTEADVGIYNTALKIGALISVIHVGINTIAMPKFAELNDNMLKFKKFAKQSTFLIIITSLPILLIILIFPEFLLNIFGNEFIVGKNALIILTSGMFFTILSGSTIHILNMTGNEKISQNILLISAVLNFVFNYVLIPPYGIVGAAIATASTTVIWNLMTQIYIYKKFKFVTYPFL